ncbi:hypothetical protein Tco_1248684 [Tanacetum coccineum]
MMNQTIGDSIEGLGNPKILPKSGRDDVAKLGFLRASNLTADLDDVREIQTALQLNPDVVWTFPDGVSTLWAADEETLLTAFYIGVFEDNQVENDQKDESFSYKVLNEFNKTSHHKRKRDMLMRKCATLNGNCQKFNVIYKRLKRLSKSGENEVDFMTRVGQVYADESKEKPFAQDGAWALLRPCSK